MAIGGRAGKTIEEMVRDIRNGSPRLEPRRLKTPATPFAIAWLRDATRSEAAGKELAIKQELSKLRKSQLARVELYVLRKLKLNHGEELPGAEIKPNSFDARRIELMGLKISNVRKAIVAGQDGFAHDAFVVPHGRYGRIAHVYIPAELIGKNELLNMRRIVESGRDVVHALQRGSASITPLRREHQINLLEHAHAKSRIANALISVAA